MKNARAADAPLWSLTGLHGVVPACVRAVLIGCVQAVALYWSELWWDPMERSRRDDLQLLLNRQARSTLGALRSTPIGTLMTDSGLTPAAVALDAWQQRCVWRLASACAGSKAKELYNYPTPGVPVGRVAAMEHARGNRAETMCSPDPGEKPAVRTTILDDATAKRAAELWAQSKESKAGSGTWTWWADGSRTDDGRVGATAVCLTREGWTVFRGYLGTGWMEVSNSELWAIGVALRQSVARAEALPAHGVTTVAVFSDSQAAIRRTVHQDPGPGQYLARTINKHARALHAPGIEAAIHWVLGHSGVPWNNEADRQATKAREDRGYTVCERIYTSAATRATRISEGRTAAKAKWEAHKCSKHYGYRLKGKAGSWRPIPMTRVKSLATRFYRLKSGHAPVGTYVKRFGHREDDKCGWCGSRTLQMREHLFRYCSQWNDQQTELWKAVGNGKWADAGMCISLSFSPWKDATKRWWTSASNWRREVPAKTNGGARTGWARAGLKVFGPGAVCLSFRRSLWSLFGSLCFFLSL